MLDTIPDYTFAKAFVSVLDPKTHNNYCGITNNFPVNYNSTRITDDIESTSYAKGYDEIYLVRATGDAFIGGLAGRFLKGNVILYNKRGQRIHQSISNIITAKLSYINHDSTSHTSSLEAADDMQDINADDCYVSVKLLTNGLFEVSYIPHKSGLYNLHVLCNGKHIENSPFDVKILHGPAYGPNCFIEALEYHSHTQYNGLLIHAVDSEDNRIEIGGDNFDIVPIGNVKIISTRDLSNGDYLVTYSVSNFYVYEKCQIQVKLNGLEIKNSPFSLNQLIHTPQKDFVKHISKEYQMLLQLKNCLENKKRIQLEHAELSQQIQKVRDDCNMTYVALNKKIVYNLPVNLKLEDLDKRKIEQQDMMKEYIKKHAELAQRAEKIDQDTQRLVELEREIIDTLRDKFKQLKETNRKYILSHKIMENELIRKTMERRKSSNKNSSEYSNSCSDIRDSRNEYYYSDNLGCVPGFYHSGKQNKNTFKICETKPDNPHSPAFWLVEGRFLHKIA